MISPPSPSIAPCCGTNKGGEQRGETCEILLKWRFATTWGGGGGAVEGDGKSWDTGHGWEPQEQPFSIGKHPLPQEHLVREVGEGAPNPSTVAAPGWVLRRGCCGEESQEPWGGLLGHPRPLPHPSGQRWPW